MATYLHESHERPVGAINRNSLIYKLYLCTTQNEVILLKT